MNKTYRFDATRGSLDHGFATSLLASRDRSRGAGIASGDLPAGTRPFSRWRSNNNS